VGETSSDERGSQGSSRGDVRLHLSRAGRSVRDDWRKERGEWGGEGGGWLVPRPKKILDQNCAKLKSFGKGKGVSIEHSHLDVS